MAPLSAWRILATHQENLNDFVTPDREIGYHNLNARSPASAVV